MKPPRLRVIAALAVGVPLALVGAWFIQEWRTRPRPVVLPPELRPHEPRLVVEPARIDLGRRSQCDGLIRVKASIRNDSDQPTVLDNWIGSCGCTVPFGSLRKGMTIAPGERHEFEVTSDSWAVSGPKNYTIDFLEAHAVAPVRMTITYIVEGPLFTSHGFFLRSYDPSIGFKVGSRDRKPFRITGAEPPALRFDPERVAEEHEVAIEWAKVAEAFGDDWLDETLVIHTDREDCPSLPVRLQGRPTIEWEP